MTGRAARNPALKGNVLLYIEWSYPTKRVVPRKLLAFVSLVSKRRGLFMFLVRYFVNISEVENVNT